MSREMEIFGKSSRSGDIRDYFSNPGVLAGVKPYIFDDGPGRGTRALDVWTSAGLQYTVVPDRGMNICGFKYGGVPLDWSSGGGLTSPFLYDPRDWGWTRSFNGGLLHTCGLSNVGEPCDEEGVHYGGHGRISNTPAENVAWEVSYPWDGGAPLGATPHGTANEISVKGRCTVANVMGEHLVLERTIGSAADGKSLHLHDRITNIGHGKTPVFLLYHCNFGFPLVSPASKLNVPANEATNIDGNVVSEFDKISPPNDSNEEELFYPRISDREVEVSLFNPELSTNGLGIYMKYSRESLPFLTIWKFFQKRTYVLAIEPGTCYVEGRTAEMEKGRAAMLDTDESYETDLEIGVQDE